jgi:hypothetical protein
MSRTASRRRGDHPATNMNGDRNCFYTPVPAIYTIRGAFTPL